MKKILIYESRKDIRQKLLTPLVAAGFATLIAETQSETVQVLQESQPDLVICSYSVSALMREELFREIQTVTIDSFFPILILSEQDPPPELNLPAHRRFLAGAIDHSLLVQSVRDLLFGDIETEHIPDVIPKSKHDTAHFHYDQVTGLPGLQLLKKYLAKAIEESAEVSPIAVLVIDLDRFRNINDALGHDSGDLLLQSISQRLIGCIGDSDKVFHLGEDKFSIVLLNILQDHEASDIAMDLIHAIKQTIYCQDYEIHMTASIGISLYPNDSKDMQKLLRYAEAGMYQAKEQGRNNYQFYSGMIKSRAFDRLTIETGMHRALKREEFKVYYQPQVDISTNRIVGCEALIRWYHPHLGWVSPNQFIPLAEETDLIISIGEWVMRTACQQNKRWMDQGFPALRLTVNVSGQQFKRTDIVQSMAQILQETQHPPELLEIELTESVLMKTITNTVTKLSELKKIGVAIAVDDFGTGYSSLAYLKRFRVNTLKIDQSFVRDINDDSDDAAIVIAIISMAHSLGMKVIAEGVENREQLMFLKQHGCDEIQGYYFSQPLPAEQFFYLFERDYATFIDGFDTFPDFPATGT